MAEQTVIQREAPEIEAYKLGLMEQAKALAGTAPTPDQLEELAESSDWEKWRKEVNKIPKDRRVLEVPWHIDDVHDIREDLTAEQCAEVLEAVGDNHDSEIGVNWDVISFWAEDLFPEKV